MFLFPSLFILVLSIFKTNQPVECQCNVQFALEDPSHKFQPFLLQRSPLLYALAKNCNLSYCKVLLYFMHLLKIANFLIATFSPTLCACRGLFFLLGDPSVQKRANLMTI